MINMLDAVRSELRDTDFLTEILGADQDEEYKVYKIPVKKNVEPPYITLQLVPIRGVDDVYGDSEVMENFIINVAVWHESHKLAWTIVDPLHDAMLQLHPQVEPYEVISIKRYRNPHPVSEPSSNLYEVVIQYEILIAR